MAFVMNAVGSMNRERSFICEYLFAVATPACVAHSDGKFSTTNIVVYIAG
jgi:hypothetical protein